MMGRKQKLTSGAEYDLIFAKDIYCYLRNHVVSVRKIKHGLNKRYRKSLKDNLTLDLREEEHI
jgi:hypothetical protein